MPYQNLPRSWGGITWVPYITRHHKVSDPPIFSTLEESTKEDPWGDTWKPKILGQDRILEAGEYLLTPTEIPSQIPTNLEEVKNMK